MKHKNLFILTAPYTGSTLLTALLGTSPKVSILPTPQHEGMKLPGLRETFWSRPDSQTFPLPWRYLEQVYRRHWDLSKPVLVEKGQFMRHGASIQEAFPDAYFICMQRDPYAWCESIRRRRPPDAEELPIDTIARRWASQAAWQMHNTHVLKRVLQFTYEDLCDRTPEVLKQLKSFMRELDGMDPARSFKVHSTLGNTHNPITNTNAAAIARLSAQDTAAISGALAEHPDLLEFFGYRLR